MTATHLVFDCSHSDEQVRVSPIRLTAPPFDPSTHPRRQCANAA